MSVFFSAATFYYKPHNFLRGFSLA